MAFFGFRSLLRTLAPSRKSARPTLEPLDERIAPAMLRVGATETYHTIQAAVNAAHANDKILVDPGTYTEQVIIPSTDTGLTLKSTRPWAAVIQAPATMTGTKAIVDDAGATGVTIADFTITGPGGSSANSINYGIRIDSGGSATIEGNHITKIRDNPLAGTQNGVAIQVGRQAENTSGSADIDFNVIDDYQKAGIVVSNTGSSAQIEHNLIRGVGPTTVIAQNGVQISDAASGRVSKNYITGNVYSPQTFQATGVLLFNPGTVRIDHNEITHNDTGIFVQGGTGLTIDHNEVEHSTMFGILLFGVSSSHVSHNETEHNGSGQPGHAGIALVTSTGNTVDHNDSDHNNGDGIFVDSTSTGNTLSHNSLEHNSIFDAEDDSTGAGTGGTANTWTHNHGKKDNRGGALLG
jgi:parallel beta-helix repeat protein